MVISINKLKSLLPFTSLFGTSNPRENFNEKQEGAFEISTGAIIIILIFLVIIFIIFILTLVGIYNLSPPDTKIMHVGLTIATSGFWMFIWIVYYGLFTDKFLQSPMGLRNNKNSKK